VRNLFAEDEAIVRLEENESESFERLKRVRQDDVLPPILSNICSKCIFRRSFER